MTELEKAIIGDSASAPASHILEGLNDEIAHRAIPNAPHTIYQELWHLSFWMRIELDWINGIEAPYPASTSIPFETGNESWNELTARFFQLIDQAAAIARDTAHLDEEICCTSRPGHPIRTMTRRDQLISMAAHNSYHLARIVLLRQLQGQWPPPSGGFSW